MAFVSLLLLQSIVKLQLVEDSSSVTVDVLSA